MANAQGEPLVQTISARGTSLRQSLTATVPQPTRREAFVPMHQRPSFQIFGSTAQSAQLQVSNLLDSHTFSHGGRVLSETDATRMRQLMNNPNVISLCSDPDYDSNAKRFHRRLVRLDAGDYPDKNFDTPAAVWDRQLRRAAKQARTRALNPAAAALSHTHTLSSTRADAAVASRGVTARGATAPLPLRGVNSRSQSLGPLEALHRGPRADERPESEHLERVLAASQLVRTQQGTSVRSARGKTLGSPYKQPPAEKPRPLYPYGLSSKYPYAPLDFRAVAPQMRD